jgi:hypothetical protein
VQITWNEFYWSVTSGWTPSVAISSGSRSVRKLKTFIKQVFDLPNPNATIKPHRNGVVVTFSNKRRQIITVGRQNERYMMSSVVLGRARVADIGRSRLLSLAWQRNRETNVVAFSLDKRGRLVGQVEQLVETIDPEELAFYIELLARECDQFEYALSGKDLE